MTTDEKVEIGHPGDIGAILATDTDKRNNDQRKRITDYFKAQDKDLAVKNKELGEAKKKRPEDPKLKELKAGLAKAEQPLSVDPKLAEFRRALELSKGQQKNHPPDRGTGHRLGADQQPSVPIQPLTGHAKMIDFPERDF